MTTSTQTNERPAGERAELLRELHNLADHQIPYSAYGDNEAASDMANRLSRMSEIAAALLEADAQANDLWEIYLNVSKISGSALLAGEQCHESDKEALYRIACEVLNGIGCVYYDITGEWPNLNAPHKAAALLAADAQRPALKPLSEQEIDILAAQVWEYPEDDMPRLIEFTRNIEVAHGIKGQA